jgi:DNA helicase-2/ATP-dependent DNA helicase PcrA
MLTRVEDLTGTPRHQFWGGTFHSIGQRILRKHGGAVGLERNFTILDQDDAESLLAEVIRGVDPAFLKNKSHPKAKVLADIISYSRNTGLTIEQVLSDRYPFFSDLPDQVEAFAQAYAKRKRDSQVADYDDLLELWLKAMNADPAIAEEYQQRFDHVLVDEYQDTNELQARIIDKIASRHQVMAVGDDAQCIYTWRGANFENIMTFSDRHPETVIHKIQTNYRSTPDILSFANGVLRNQPVGSGYEKELRASRPADSRPYFVPLMDGRQQAQFIIQRTQGLLDEGRSLSDIAVLYRAHYQAMEVQMELSRANIPYQITSGVRFFEQAHVRDLTAQLRFASNPTDTTAFGRFTGLLPKVGPRSAEKIYRFARSEAEKREQDFIPFLADAAVLAKVPKDAREEWPSLAQTLIDLWSARDQPPDEIVRLAVEGWYGTFIREVYPNWAQRVDDLESLIGFAAQHESLTELLAQLVLLSSETSDRSTDTGDRDAMRLTTIHQAKGLEFPVVFVIGLADGLFPLKRAIEEGTIEEERRLFYVAVTRAMDELYLAYPMIQTQGGPPQRNEASRFIRETDPETFETLRFRSGW